MNTPNINKLIDAWANIDSYATYEDVSHAMYLLREDLQQEPDDITTLRGLVLVESDKGTSVMVANENGLSHWSKDSGLYGWAEVKECGWTVRKLTEEDL
jgi:hypothetical protein